MLAASKSSLPKFTQMKWMLNMPELVCISLTGLWNVSYWKTHELSTVEPRKVKLLGSSTSEHLGIFPSLIFSLLLKYPTLQPSCVLFSSDLSWNTVKSSFPFMETVLWTTPKAIRDQRKWMGNTVHPSCSGVVFSEQLPHFRAYVVLITEGIGNHDKMSHVQKGFCLL